MLYSKAAPPTHVNRPNYQTLADWWRAWPEARPEALDFWARGGYMQRILWRRQQQRQALLVRVSYIDELESALKRLAILDVDIDFLWSGDLPGAELVMAPQDVDYEGVGGWGYITCAGDELAERRINREWCPALAFARLLPDNVTDWLAEDAIDFTEEGRIIVCPFEALGAPKSPNDRSEKSLQDLSASASIVNLSRTAELLASLDLPVFEGMSIRDMHRFCQDYTEELRRFRKSVGKLVASQRTPSSPDITSLVQEVQGAIDEIRASERTRKMRNAVVAAGGLLASYQLAVSLSSGLDQANLAAATGSAALAALTWWVQKITSSTEARRAPFWIAWKLQQGKTQSTFTKPRLVDRCNLRNNVQKDSFRSIGWHHPPAAGRFQRPLFLAERMADNQSLQPTCYPYDCSTVNEDGKLFDGSSRKGVACTRLNLTLFGLPVKAEALARLQGAQQDT